jgi:hypothetical protein
MIEVRPFYLSKTDVDPFFDSFKDKLEKNEIPSIMEFYNFIYLPELLDRREKKMNPASGGEQTENLICEAAFKLLLKCRDLLENHKAFKLALLAHLLVLMLKPYVNKITEEQELIFLKE